ncbi:hypothetical protein GCM10009122_49180 [Fulvivirga kasyanovii]|uniref:Four-helix bundle copper-binding protein n=1 Tax=Fulvivirga kasyanovii TaxID=396812 RepID=A0ABW9RH22_9BACT|nr:hypothetical protein [Fulvivirga kasyanovii]MTI23362.1 hypothetical protein [Fulvivirga kasyanovii]
MEKSILLDTIYECVEACENLATACTHSPDKKIGNNCLSEAIDCADAGMILIIRLNEEPHSLHRNLFKQFVSYCKECINACEKHHINQALRAAITCKKAIQFCSLYVTEHVHVDEYQFATPSQSRKNFTQRWKPVATE